MINQPLTVLSCFDGISCGQVALQKAGISAYKYFASEIDEAAIKTTMANWPSTIQLGDIKQIALDKLSPIDLLIGGSPCQGFSFAGKQLAFDDMRSALFFEYVKILYHCKPRWFLLENVKMAGKYQHVISTFLGCSPVLLDSMDISAQRRSRLYWTNIPITPLIKKPKTLREVLIEPTDFIDITDRFYSKKPGTLAYKKAYSGLVDLESQARTMCTGGQNITNSGATNIFCNGGQKILTPSPNGAEVLHGLPRGYTQGAKTQRYKQVGNGWHIDVITHIFQGLQNQ